MSMRRLRNKQMKQQQRQQQECCDKKMCRFTPLLPCVYLSNDSITAAAVAVIAECVLFLCCFFSALSL